MKLPPLWGSLFPETFKFTRHPRLSSDQALASAALRGKRITVASVALEFQSLRCLGKFRKVSLETIYSPNSLQKGEECTLGCTWDSGQHLSGAKLWRGMREQGPTSSFGFCRRLIAPWSPAVWVQVQLPLLMAMWPYTGDLSFWTSVSTSLMGGDNNRSYLIELLERVGEAHLVKLRMVPEKGSVCCLKKKQASKPREMAGFVQMSPVPLWRRSVLAGESTHGGWSGRHVKDRECLSSVPGVSWSLAP